MRPTRPRAWLIALLLGAVLVAHLGGCNRAPHHTPTPPAFQANAGPLVAVSPTTLSLSGAWQFAVDPDAEGHTRGWAQPAFDDAGWLSVTVPHTWNVMPEHADYAGIAWYRRQLTLPPLAGEAHVRLRFGAVFYLAQVWWNGVYLGEHEGGYTPFEFDVSGLARPGAANVLAVRVDNQRAMDRLPAALPTHWSYDWWHYGGIVREVALHLSSRAFIAQQRLVAVPALVDVGRAATATLAATVTVTNASAQPLQGMLTGEVRHETGWPSVLTATPAMAVDLPPGASQEISLTAMLSDPML
ncbi:MAG TPA: beta galactosidase jelly roll domain-containing protein, partial [Candidatus Tectomicrobia bacterium]